jgi:ribosomal protein S18 acetylase RimI-like enzyme
VKLRSLEPGDVLSLESFCRRIPPGDRTFFKEDVLEGSTVAAWLIDRRGKRFIAVEEDGTVTGYVAIVPGVGWSSHVGELRLIVDPARRRQGLGRELARRGLVEAIGLGLSKIQVELVLDQEGAIAMFQSLGFEPEALLRDQVRDRNGGLHDLILLCHTVNDVWSEMSTLGIDQALA